MTATLKRNESEYLAQSPETWLAALELARSIDDAWFRCQALSTAGEKAPNPELARTILQESFAAAYAQTEPNRAVTVASWPIAVLCKCQDYPWLEQEINRALECIATEPHPTRRADALRQVLFALPRTQHALALRVTNALIETCKVGHGWRRDRILRDSALYLNSLGLTVESDCCMELIASARLQRQTRRRRRR